MFVWPPQNLISFLFIKLYLHIYLHNFFFNFAITCAYILFQLRMAIKILFKKKTNNWLAKNVIINVEEHFYIWIEIFLQDELFIFK